MTEDLIAMARIAGMEVHERKGEVRIGSAIITGCDCTEQVERFAALIEARAVARTREECAVLCAKRRDDADDRIRFGFGDKTIELAAALEANACADAIRALGERT